MTREPRPVRIISWSIFCLQSEHPNHHSAGGQSWLPFILHQSCVALLHRCMVDDPTDVAVDHSSGSKDQRMLPLFCAGNVPAAFNGRGFSSHAQHCTSQTTQKGILLTPTCSGWDLTNVCSVSRCCLEALTKHFSRNGLPAVPSPPLPGMSPPTMLSHSFILKRRRSGEALHVCEKVQTSLAKCEHTQA